MSCFGKFSNKSLITTYQEVNDLSRSDTCCNDENVRMGGNTHLPEQHSNKIKTQDIVQENNWLRINLMTFII
jgi:hypothetical protein